MSWAQCKDSRASFEYKKVAEEIKGPWAEKNAKRLHSKSLNILMLHAKADCVKDLLAKGIHFICMFGLLRRPSERTLQPATADILSE